MAYSEQLAERIRDALGGRPGQFTGRRPMRGFVLVDGGTVAEDDELGRWVDAGADFALSLPPK